MERWRGRLERSRSFPKERGRPIWTVAYRSKSAIGVGASPFLGKPGRHILGSHPLHEGVGRVVMQDRFYSDHVVRRGMVVQCVSVVIFSLRKSLIANPLCNEFAPRPFASKMRLYLSN